MAETETVSKDTTIGLSKEMPIKEFSGTLGGPFGIYGLGFGDMPGTVTLNGAPMVITRWRDKSIKGTMPIITKPWSIVVITADGTKFTGKFV